MSGNYRKNAHSLSGVSEKGASLVEFAVSLPVLFLLVTMLTDLSHMLLLRSTLLAGVQRGLQTAQNLPELLVDSSEIEPQSNSFDREKYERYMAARRFVVQRATETPLQLFFQPPDVSDSNARLVRASTSDVFQTAPSATSEGMGAALLLPNDVAIFSMKDGEFGFANPAICKEVLDPHERESLKRNPQALRTYCRAQIESAKENLRAGRSIHEEYPLMVRACGRKKTVFFGEREFCESAMGYQRALSRSGVEEQSELASTAVVDSDTSNPKAPQAPCAIEQGTVCGFKSVNVPPCVIEVPPIGPIPNHGIQQFNCTNIPPNAIHEQPLTWLGAGSYRPCCSGSFRTRDAGEQTFLCLGEPMVSQVTEYVCD